MVGYPIAMDETKEKPKRVRKKPPPGKGRVAGSPQVKRPRALREMQMVYDTDGDGLKDHPRDTPGQKTCRAFLRENRQAFLALLHKMSAEYRVKKEKVEQEAKAKERPTGPSEGVADILALIDRLWAEWEQQ